jgi:hypothetical protein
MSGAAVPDLTPTAQRALAAQLFNRTWELLESARSSADDRVMLACAVASRLHWTGIGTDENYAAGDWLVAHVASHLGYADVALDFAASAYETALAAEPPVPAWLIASTQEGLARANAAAGHDDEREPLCGRRAPHPADRRRRGGPRADRRSARLDPGAGRLTSSIVSLDESGCQTTTSGCR